MCVCVPVCVCVSLGGGVVELVLPGAAKAGCDAAILPESLHHAGQLRRHKALLRRAGQDEQLARVVLETQSTSFTNIGNLKYPGMF